MANRNISTGVLLDREDRGARTKMVRTLTPTDGRIAIVLLQSAGKPAVPIVLPGDRVRTGSLIARADGALSANLHAPVSGKVCEIGSTKLTDGTDAPCIWIENDNNYEELAYPDPTGRERQILAELTRESLIRSVRDAGIVGLGGAGMPTESKLAESDPARIDTVICNAVACDPLDGSDLRTAIEKPWRVIAGMAALLRAFPRARGFIAVPEGNGEAFRALQERIARQNRLFVRHVPDIYPMGSERMLIRELTGRALNAKILPADIGCLMLNVQTVEAIAQAVFVREPLVTRRISLQGPLLRTQGVFQVRLGMSLRDLVQEAGGIKGAGDLKETLVIEGGFMMGRIVQTLESPVTKLTGALYVTRKGRDPRLEAGPGSACINCGACRRACPIGLSPATLYGDASRGKEKAFARHYGLECNGCGCCSYVCPSRLDLSDAIAAERGRILRSGAHPEYVRRSDRYEK